MREDTTIPFRNPALRDELSELVRAGAQRGKQPPYPLDRGQKQCPRRGVDSDL